MGVFFSFFAILLMMPAAWPQCDLIFSAWFYREGSGFFLADHPLLLSLHWLAYAGARVLGILVIVMMLAAYRCSKTMLGLNAKAWLFLLLALLIGPGLIANVGFKDHWGRARPREVVEFGGTEKFSPALTPHFANAKNNGSFVAGDAAFGFFLPSFAYGVPRRLARRVFWSAMAAGGAFGFARLAMGAHFFSDIVYAAFFMLTISAGLYSLMYGWAETKNRCHLFFKQSPSASAT